MASPVYATQADLAASPYVPDTVTVPADASRLLARASRRIDRMLLAAVYATDPITEQPTSSKVAEALRQAVCAQVAWWLETGDETGQAAQYASVSIGSVTLSRGTQAARVTTPSGASIDAPPAPAAIEILTTAGLLTQPPGTYWPAWAAVPPA